LRRCVSPPVLASRRCDAGNLSTIPRGVCSGDLLDRIGELKSAPRRAACANSLLIREITGKSFVTRYPQGYPYPLRSKQTSAAPMRWATRPLTQLGETTGPSLAALSHKGRGQRSALHRRCRFNSVDATLQNALSPCGVGTLALPTAAAMTGSTDSRQVRGAAAHLDL
jgi:hypothetical protein